MNTKIELDPLTLDLTNHRGSQVVLLKFPKNRILDEAIKKVNGARWTRTYSCWQVTYSVAVINQIKIIFDPLCKIDATLLKEKIASKKVNPHIVSVPATLVLADETKVKMNQFKEWLQSRRYSSNTINTYMDALKAFLRFFSNKAVREITNADVITFNNEFVLKHKLSASYQNQVVNAIKLFFKTVEGRAIEIELIHRPKRQKLLPNVLSKEEVKLILNAHGNLKHKAMLSLIYSCGLRRSELLNLKLTDVDSKRQLLLIKQAKGRKDRIAPLSAKTLELLQSYYVAFKPKYWLFEGQDKSKRYDESSLGAVLKQALEKNNIVKPVTLHWLRHSYATHLLESGTDLRYIQEILGHSRSTTTEIYTHVSNKSIQRIVSPFDSL
ncbi:MAG: tyrosine-type recombinase/integrase [Bacteroidia bacterium]